MSKKSCPIAKFFLLILSLCLLTHLTLAQSSPGQYLEEAPLGTWNIFGLESAASLGTGCHQVTQTYSNTVGLSNPAILAHLPETTFTFNLGFNQAELFKYWLVNTGVLKTSANLPYRSLQINYLGLSQSIKGWSFALSYATVENYGRPGIDYQDSFYGQIYHQLKIYQAGNLKTYAFSIARKLNSRFCLGLSLIEIKGHLERKLEESWPGDEIQMLDYRSQKIRGFYPVFGLSFRISSRAEIGLSFVPPYRRKADGHSELTYCSGEGESEIKIQGEATDLIKMPPVVALGSRFSFRQNLESYLELVYFGWNKYYFSYFGEELNRNFHSVIRISSGLEYRSSFRLFGRTWNAPYYVGVMIDPQPMSDVSSTYYYLTFGSGLSNDFFSLTFSSAIGLERGSGRHLKNQKISITLDVYPDLKKILRGKKNEQK